MKLNTDLYSSFCVSQRPLQPEFILYRLGIVRSLIFRTIDLTIPSKKYPGSLKMTLIHYWLIFFHFYSVSSSNMLAERLRCGLILRYLSQKKSASYRKFVAYFRKLSEFFGSGSSFGCISAYFQQHSAAYSHQYSEAYRVGPQIIRDFFIRICRPNSIYFFYSKFESPKNIRDTYSKLDFFLLLLAHC